MSSLVDKVQRNLWDRGFSVKDRSEDGLGFDLLVEGKHRVRVVEHRPKDVDWNAYDVIAKVMFGKGAFAGRMVIHYSVPKDNNVPPKVIFIKS